MSYQITLLPGDGIGPEVTEAALLVLQATGIKIKWERAIAGQQAIEKYYSKDSKEKFDKIIKDIKDSEDIEFIRESEGDLEKEALQDITQEAPMIKLIDTIVQQAVVAKASDVFIEPMEKTLRIRYRVDGIIREIDQMSKALHLPIISRRTPIQR